MDGASMLPAVFVSPIDRSSTLIKRLTCTKCILEIYMYACTTYLEISYYISLMHANLDIFGHRLYYLYTNTNKEYWGGAIFVSE